MFVCIYVYICIYVYYVRVYISVTLQYRSGGQVLNFKHALE